MSVFERPGNRAQLGLSIHNRLAEIEKRLTELRQSRQQRPGSKPAPVLAAAGAQQHAHDAERHRLDSISRMRQVRQSVVHALVSAARAHDHAAQACDRAAHAGIGDIAEHLRKAEFHRAAAEADRQRAQDMRGQERTPPPSG